MLKVYGKKLARLLLLCYICTVTITKNHTAMKNLEIKSNAEQAEFRSIEFTMSRGNGYGQYYVHATYKGEQIKAHTTDSEAWDYLEDDSNEEKHMAALRHCYNKIVAEYEKTRG